MRRGIKDVIPRGVAVLTGATIALNEEVEAVLKASEISRDRVEDASLILSVGDSVEAKFTGVDRKNRVINLSIKAKDEAEEQEAMASLNKSDEGAFGNAMADAFKAAKGE